MRGPGICGEKSPSELVDTFSLSHDGISIDPTKILDRLENNWPLFLNVDVPVLISGVWVVFPENTAPIVKFSIRTQ